MTSTNKISLALFHSCARYLFSYLFLDSGLKQYYLRLQSAGILRSTTRCLFSLSTAPVEVSNRMLNKAGETDTLFLTLGTNRTPSYEPEQMSFPLR